MSNTEYFIDHLKDMVQDRFDLSDDQMEQLTALLTRFNSPKDALKKALRNSNRSSIDSMLGTLSDRQRHIEIQNAPLPLGNGMSLPGPVPYQSSGGSNLIITQ